MVPSPYSAKKVISFDTDDGAVGYILDDKIFRNLLRAALRDVTVDDSWYTSRYPEAAEALQAGMYTSAKDHFIAVGYIEHKLPRAFVVDEAFYASAYHDVADALAHGHLSSFQDHFERYGYAEGRIPYENFSLF